MAFGRMDQFLYPYYRHDIDAGILTDAEAQELLENTYLKIYERRVWLNSDDVCNIAIAGVTPEGEDATNELTYLILQAVRMLCIAWFAFLIVAGLGTIHEYGLGGNLASIVMSVAAAAIILFIGVLLFTMLERMVSFFTSVGQELMRRL